MRNGFLLSLGALLLCVCVAPAQSEYNGNLPSEQDIQVLPTIRIVVEIRELPPLVVTRPPDAPPASLLPPSVAASPEKTTATPPEGPPTTATLAACCPPANAVSIERLPRLRALMQLLRYTWWKMLHRN
jgi:hypothetical protein